MKMALVHDLAEAIVGDITPDCGVTPEEKHRMEQEAMIKIESTLAESHAHIGKEIRELWEEYEAASTKEALICKDLDKFDMVAQADQYEREQGATLPSFFESTTGVIKHPLIASWDAQIRENRETVSKD
mmetsp:Transcript_54341/g.118205  ORF Transcript_54341/g.118205 Transcript_54341/m.118205 type:complete len:129 (-) Transcript_54341:39-425(-)